MTLEAPQWDPVPILNRIIYHTSTSFSRVVSALFKRRRSEIMKGLKEGGRKKERKEEASERTQK